jgi:magnesium transporter
MSTELAAIALLEERFLIDYPNEAARALESMPMEASITVLRSRSSAALLRGWPALAPDRGAQLLQTLPVEVARQLLCECEPQACGAALAFLPTARRDALLAALPAPVAQELQALAQYPKDSVGHLMDPRVGALGVAITVAEATERLRSLRVHGLRDLFVVDEQMQLVGQVALEDMVLSSRERPIREIMRSPAAVVRDSDPVSAALAALREQPLDVLPVISDHGRFIGVIRLPTLLAAGRRRARWWRLN